MEFTCVGFFVEGGRPENPEKNPRSKDQNQSQTQPMCDAGFGNHIGGRRALSPLRHPSSQAEKVNRKSFNKVLIVYVSYC